MFEKRKQTLKFDIPDILVWIAILTLIIIKSKQAIVNILSKEFFINKKIGNFDPQNTDVKLLPLMS